MAEEKKRKSKCSGKPIWIFMIILVILVIGLGIWRFVINKDDGGNVEENVASEEQVVNEDYNGRLQEVEKEINSKEEEINKLNEEMLPLMEERTNLEQQLIDLNEESVESGE